MNILEPIIQEIQKETGLILTKGKDIRGRTCYTTKVGNNILIFGICHQTVTAAWPYKHPNPHHYNGTHFLIIKTYSNIKFLAPLFQDLHQFIDLNHPNSIQQIINTTKQYANLKINQNPTPATTKKEQTPLPKAKHHESLRHQTQRPKNHLHRPNPHQCQPLRPHPPAQLRLRHEQRSS